MYFGLLPKTRKHRNGPPLSTRASLHARPWSEVDREARQISCPSKQREALAPTKNCSSSAPSMRLELATAGRSPVFRERRAAINSISRPVANVLVPASSSIWARNAMLLGYRFIPSGSSRKSVRFPPISPVCCGVYVIHAQAIKRTCCFHPPTCYVRFSTRPVWVKRFQTIHCCSVDVARGLVLLSGIGSPAFCLFAASTIPGRSTRYFAQRQKYGVLRSMPAISQLRSAFGQSGHPLLRCTCPLSGVERTCHFALHMSAFDPKRTSRIGTSPKR